MKSILNLLIIHLCVFSFSVFAQPGINELHGDQEKHRRGIHDGNQIRTTFGNDGQIGRRGAAHETLTKKQFPGEWPVTSGRVYLAKIIMLPMAEVRDEDGRIQHIVSECHGTGTALGYGWPFSVGDLAPDGTWQTMCPLPGFINADLLAIADEDSAFPAMSDNPRSWPASWPDQIDAEDPGWAGQWNGYFGRGQTEADQESYWVADDYQNNEFSFFPDSSDLNRGGLGLRMYYRGLQWTNPLVNDVMFVIYDVENIGSGILEKVNFGMQPDLSTGPVLGEWDETPDWMIFDKEADWFYKYDRDDIGSQNFSPVGYVAYALFETPGNEFDGIDNDNDAEGNPDKDILTFELPSNPSKRISEADFTLGPLQSNTQIIIIDYESKTFERKKTTLTDLQQEVPELFSGDTLIFDFIGRPQKFYVGKALDEVAFDNFDNNLNGWIDENNGAIVGIDGGTQQLRYVYTNYLAIDFFSDGTLHNPMIDESRKDGIDNNDDWSSSNDYGLDGDEGTGDTGENDGKATSIYQLTDSGMVVLEGRGEPGIDVTDVDESDMLGMTSFGINPNATTTYFIDDDEMMWDITKPGNIANQDEEIKNAFMGSGYFPMPAGQIERFSGAFMLNYTLDGLKRTKRNSETAYDGNYKFHKAPDQPTLTAVPGDGKVTLYWDDAAEFSYDPLEGADFEGYRIYRGTEQEFKDMVPITDAYGEQKYRKPLIQFDLDNDISGLTFADVEGIKFDRGNNSGLLHSWVDTNIVNGQRYIYYITSYDRGNDAFEVPVSECGKSLIIDPVKDVVGKISPNVAIVTPNAPSAGYIAAKSDLQVTVVSGISNSSMGIEIVDSPVIIDGATYQVTFEDTITGQGGAAKLKTKTISLVNKGTGKVLIDRFTGVDSLDEFLVTEGFRLFLYNYDFMRVDTSRTQFLQPNIYKPVFKPFAFRSQANPKASDYRIEFGEIGIDTSIAFKPETRSLKAIPINFTVTNLSENRKVLVALYDRDTAGDSTKGMLTYRQSGRNFKDIAYFIEPDKNDSLIATWKFNLDASTDPGDTLNPGPGDVFEAYTLKPFLSPDVLEFTTVAEKIDKTIIKDQMKRIKVVPNPYLVSNAWERPNPYSTGRGPRELHFNHLPEKCTIRIFDLTGQLVDVIEHDSEIIDGTEIWDMLTKDELEIGFGIYLYHVEAEGIGSKTGKFAVIK